MAPPAPSGMKLKRKKPNGNKRRRSAKAGGGAEVGIQLLRTHQSAAAAEYYSSDTEPPGGLHSAMRDDDDSDDNGDDDEGALLHSRMVDDELGGHESGDEYGAEPGGLGDPVDIYGNALPTIDHITNPPVLEATEEARTVLHSRAEAWYASIVPTPDEHTMRLKVVAELRAVVTAEWQGQAQLQVFGSSATGLLLKGGDIDMVILGLGIESKEGGGGFVASDRAKVAKQLSRLAKALQKANLVQRNSLLLIGKARVPIIKFRENLSGLGLPCDISVGCVNGLHTVQWVRSQLQCYPLCVPLTVILKRFLEQRNMNEPVNGGIGGYLLINLVVSYVKRAYRQHSAEVAHAAGPTGDLGMLLLGFVEYYANRFDYNKYAVASAHPTGVKAKRTLTFTAGVPFPELRTELSHTFNTLKPMLHDPSAPTLQALLSRRAPRSARSTHGGGSSPHGSAAGKGQKRTPRKSELQKGKKQHPKGTPITQRAMELMSTPKSQTKQGAAKSKPTTPQKSLKKHELLQMGKSALSQFLEEDLRDGARRPGRVKGKGKGKAEKGQTGQQAGGYLGVKNGGVEKGGANRCKGGAKGDRGNGASPAAANGAQGGKVRIPPEWQQGQRRQQGQQAGGHLGVKHGGVEKGAKKGKGGGAKCRRGNAASPATGNGGKGGKGGGRHGRSRGWSHEM